MSHLKESVEEKDSKFVDLVQDRGYFWMLKAYRQHIGNPKETKAEVVSLQVGGLKSKGVVTKDGPPDPLPPGSAAWE